MRSLADIAPGQSAHVVDVAGEDSIASRLMEMGITEGETIDFVGRAPMGDPIEVSIRGYRLSLRLVEARRILIRDQAPPTTDPKP